MKGSVLIEGILGLALLIPVSALALEVVRASWEHATVQNLCFEYSRNRFLGAAEAEARRQMRRTLGRSHPNSEAIFRYFDSGVSVSAERFSGWVRWRYSGLMGANFSRSQVTKRCFFSYSR